MEELLIILKAQPVFVIILAVIAGLIIFAIVKKLVKILAVLCLVLCVYMGYLVYKGKTITISRKHIEEYRDERVKELKKLGPGDVLRVMKKAESAHDTLTR